MFNGKTHTYIPMYMCLCMTFLLFACICFCVQVPCSWGNPLHAGWGNGTRHCWPTGNWTFGLLDTTRLAKFHGDLTRPGPTWWFMRESFNFQVCEHFLISQTISFLRHPNIRTKLHAIFEDFWHVGTLSRLAIYALRCFDTSSHASRLTWLSTFDLTEVQNELDLAQPYMDKAPVVGRSNKNCCSEGDGSEPSPKSSYDSFIGVNLKFHHSRYSITTILENTTSGLQAARIMQSTLGIDEIRCRDWRLTFFFGFCRARGWVIGGL